MLGHRRGLDRGGPGHRVPPPVRADSTGGTGVTGITVDEGREARTRSRQRAPVPGHRGHDRPDLGADRTGPGSARTAGPGSTGPVRGLSPEGQSGFGLRGGHGGGTRSDPPGRRPGLGVLPRGPHAFPPAPPPSPSVELGWVAGRKTHPESTENVSVAGVRGGRRP
ncbi:hypothetical protein ACFFX0_07220 [Citricoccus parietis]|uniref:Uncharacterized protein n=1 Tax=Citricoccus parietis TaxID=592307 RepID=A0ABV5FXN2_9MICC